MSILYHFRIQKVAECDLLWVLSAERLLLFHAPYTDIILYETVSFFIGQISELFRYDETVRICFYFYIILQVRCLVLHNSIITIDLFIFLRYNLMRKEGGK